MKNKFFIGVSVFVTCLIIGYGATMLIKFQNRPSPAKTNRLQIVTSFYPLYFFTNTIVGDGADVYTIIPAGAEPHEYEPTAQDRARIEKSNLLIVNGGIEPWVEKLRAELTQRGVSVITASESLPLQDFINENGKTSSDPHVWLSPVLAQQIVTTITDAIIRIDPTNAEVYRERAQNLTRELRNLDTAYRQGLSSCRQKDFITSHAAFGYIAKEYGLTQVAIAGLSPDAEPSPRELAGVADFARSKNIKYIFFESLVSPKLSETIAHEVGAETLVLNPVEGLTEEQIVQGKNYFTEMQNNLANLKTALQCQ